MSSYERKEEVVTEIADPDANPWLRLPESSPYVLTDDLAVLRLFPAAMANFVLDGPPGPFVGNPRKARVILLGLNPGFVESDRDAAGNEAIRSAWLEACRLRDDAIFHPIHPGLSIRWDGLVAAPPRRAHQRGGSRRGYGRAGLRRVVLRTPHEGSSGSAFELVRSALRRGSVPIIMRSRDLWVGSVPELARHGAIELRNKQNPTISPGNHFDCRWPGGRRPPGAWPRVSRAGPSRGGR